MSRFDDRSASLLFRGLVHGGLAIIMLFYDWAFKKHCFLPEYAVTGALSATSSGFLGGKREI